MFARNVVSMRFQVRRRLNEPPPMSEMRPAPHPYSPMTQRSENYRDEIMKQLNAWRCAWGRGIVFEYEIDRRRVDVSMESFSQLND